MGVRVKYKGEWVDPDDIPFLREQDQAQDPPVATIDVDTLPDPAALDSDVPLEQLFYDYPQVRPFITKKGQVRGGLTTGQRTVAEAILRRYEHPQFDEADHPNPEKEDQE